MRKVKAFFYLDGKFRKSNGLLMIPLAYVLFYLVLELVLVFGHGKEGNLEQTLGFVGFLMLFIPFWWFGRFSENLVHQRKNQQPS